MTYEVQNKILIGFKAIVGQDDSGSQTQIRQFAPIFYETECFDNLLLVPVELKHLVDLQDTVGQFIASYTGFDGNLCAYDIATNYPSIVSIDTTTNNESHTLTISSSTYSLSSCYTDTDGDEVCPSASDFEITLVVTITISESTYHEYEIPVIFL